MGLGKNILIIAIAPILSAILFLILMNSGVDIKVCKTAFVLSWVAIWWITEAVHLAVASLLPLVLFPLLGIMSMSETAREYTDQVIFLFVGGFILAFAMEKWGLHKRIALKILLHTGTSSSRILAGIMFATYIMSMWISNTATVMMLFPAVLSIIRQLKLTDENSRMPIGLMLALAYSATIGGMSSLVGSPPNMIFASYYNNHVENSMTFTKWYMVGMPLSLIFLIIAYFILKHLYLPKKPIQIDKNIFKTEYEALGNKSFEEKWILGVFIFTAFAWFFRADIDLGILQIKGWSNLFPYPEYIRDSTVAIFSAILLFVIPSSEKNKFLLSWDDVTKLPYDIILLFGGGFALAKGFETSGLSDLLAGNMLFLQNTHPIFITVGICFIVVILSEFASNAASIQLVLPVLGAVAASTSLEPIILMLPAAFAASLGFMLPVATAPNTIVFGSKLISVRQMMLAGFWLNLVGIFLVTVIVSTLGKLVF
jgi:solute carrier family 13 (sodium-dependent dicarboxylate transporter), member 2/3/5